MCCPHEPTRVSRALGPHCSGVIIKGQTLKSRSIHSISEALVLSDVSTRGCLAACRILTANEGTVNVKCITSPPLFPGWMGCSSTVKICNWFMYWSVSTLPRGQLTSTWKTVQSESNTSKQHITSLLKLQTFWEAFAICLRSESVTLSL